MSRSYEAIKILLDGLERTELLELFSHLKELLSENEVNNNIINLKDKSDPINLVLHHLYHGDAIEAGRHADFMHLNDLVNAYINFNVNEFNKIVDENYWTEEQSEILNSIRCYLNKIISDD